MISLLKKNTHRLVYVCQFVVERNNVKWEKGQMKKHHSLPNVSKKEETLF